MTAILAGMMVDDGGSRGEWKRKSSGEEEESGESNFGVCIFD